MNRMQNSQPIFQVQYLDTKGMSLFSEEFMESYVQPSVGMGVAAENGKRYRVVDVWLNMEKRGTGMEAPGIFAFCEPVSPVNDIPSTIWPEWYKQFRGDE